MEAVDLTLQQQAIVNARGQDVFVVAGAGSGKTSVLVSRYVELLSECGIPQIAAVTFTDAAATEMRERVRREVLSRDDLAGRRADLDKAVIGTIHSLCRQLLRENPVESAIDPAARVLSDDEAESERVTACQDALEEAAEADGHRALAAHEIGVFALSDLLSNMVARRDEVVDAYSIMAGAGPSEWLEHVHAVLAPLIEGAVEEVCPQLAESAARLQDAADSATGTDAIHERLLDVLAALGDPKDGGSGDLLQRVLDAGGRVKLTGGSAKNWDYLDGVKAEMGAIRNVAVRLKETPQWNEFDGPALEALSSLRRLFDDACARYEGRKRELAALDYLDLELKATKLLRSHPDIAASYRSRFRHLMVDELQDTNPSQIKLLNLLSRDGGPDSPGPERFFVGDVKQAIYRFRGSDVRHFTRLRDEMQATGAVLSLDQSFRAHDPLVETFNALFHHVFADPSEEFEAPMQTMTGRGPNAPEGPHLVLMPVSDQTAGGVDKALDHERRQAEAEAVASEVAAILERGAPVWDREKQALRPAVASDVAILLRRLTNVHLFELALENRKVPYRTPAGAGFFTRQEVRDLTNLLGWLAEPDDAIALVGVLRSPFFMIDDQSLLALRSQGGDLLEALRRPPEGVLNAARPLCAHAAAVLGELRRDAPTAAAHTLIEKALALTGFEAAWAPLQGGDQALANIRKFVGLARTLADHSLDELAIYVCRRRDELAAREGQAVMDASHAVRLMTVHGAKGLEFPIVFVPEAHLASRADNDSVRWRSADGISLTLARAVGAAGSRPRPGFYTYLLDRDAVEEAAEHKRLFYVAATRAADALYISGNETSSGDGWLAAASEVVGAASRDGVEVRQPLIVGGGGGARRPAPPELAPPSPDEEEDFMPPLVARPRVIPLRSSTPATALRAPAASPAFTGHGDGLGIVRGNLAHRAIELWFTNGERPALAELVQSIDAGLSAQAAERVATEVEAMLDLLDASQLAATLRRLGGRAYFELPFSWDWEGAPVHGTIDLAYQDAGGWRVLDFKTDDLRGRSLAEASEPYLPQLALYAAALERATSQRPVASLLFLRTGETYTPDAGDLDRALAATRARIAAGQALEIPPSLGFEDTREEDA